MQAYFLSAFPTSKPSSKLVSLQTISIRDANRPVRSLFGGQNFQVNECETILHSPGKKEGGESMRVL